MVEGRTTDWGSLSAVQALIHRRVIERLNAALGAINLTDDDLALERAPVYWREHAMGQIIGALNIYNAWNMLIHYKAGMVALPRSLRQFRVGDLLDWLSSETSQSYASTSDDDRLLIGNRETLQEALLLIYGCAQALGPDVRVLVEDRRAHVWFGARYRARRNQARTLTELIDRPPTDWRDENLIFELTCARDFLVLNNCQLEVIAQKGERFIGFSVPAVESKAQTLSERVAHTNEATIPASSDDSDDVLDIWRSQASDETHDTTSRGTGSED